MNLFSLKKEKKKESKVKKREKKRWQNVLVKNAEKVTKELKS